jgi:outer membrane receptor protein involved in Fe transport
MIRHSVSQRIGTLVLFSALGLAIPHAVFADGRLEGRVTGAGGTGLTGVSVLINETATSVLTDQAGRYAFDRVPSGTFTVTFALGANMLTVREVRISDGPVRLDQAVDWSATFAETITVYAASRRVEHLFDAPASVAVIDESTIARESADRQVPRALASTAGVEITQSGMFDFNVNIRGLNTSLNRRVLTLLDGRDAAGVLVGAQEWAAVSLPMDEIARIEVVRGPASALYGANAFNGVVDMTSKQPRDSLGGNVQLSAGDNATGYVSMRHAGVLAKEWSYRVQGTYGRTGDFFVARNQSVEYPGLPPEVIAPATDRTEVANAGARLDRYLPGKIFTLEGGWARADGNVILTGAGRPQNRNVHRPWMRSAFQTSDWRAFGYYDGRKGKMLSLSAGNVIFDDSMKAHGELQRQFGYNAGRGRIAAGGAVRYERADTRDESGISTILRGVQDAWSGAVYGQIDHELSTRLRVLVAGRVDRSTLHDAKVSPKVGLIHAISPTQSVRFTYGHAFQTASFVQYFTRVAAAPPLPLGGLEASLAPALGGVALGFERVPVLALGNDQLKVERIDSFETGYSGVVSNRVVLGVDYYYNHVSDLVSALLPQVGTSLGRINPQFGPYEPPAALSPSQRALVLASLRAVLPASLFPTMSNDLDGSPIFAVVSYTNVARVRVQGAEADIHYFVNSHVKANAGFAWSDFEVTRDLPEQPVSSNTPPYSLRLGMTYGDDTKSAAVLYRWSDHFNWMGGIFRGPVPSYAVTDVVLGYKFRPSTRVSLNVTNLFNNKHYEIFGGDLLRRSTLVTLTQGW